MGWGARRQRHAGETPGTIVMLTTATPRHAVAVQCLYSLDVPQGTRVELFAGCVDIVANRNNIATDFVAGAGGDWLMMIDDDQVFEPSMAMRLLRHFADDRVDIVVPLILRRAPPYEPVLFMGEPIGEPVSDDQVAHTNQLNDANRLTGLAQLTSKGGVIRVHAAGMGVMLLRRRVFDRLRVPWFELHPMISEDYLFSGNASKAGCGVYCDLDVRVGHILPAAIWPSRRTQSGRWESRLTELPTGGLRATVVSHVITAYESGEPEVV